jgi:hypothetical protein
MTTEQQPLLSRETQIPRPQDDKQPVFTVFNYSTLQKNVIGTHHTGQKLA